MGKAAGVDVNCFEDRIVSSLIMSWFGFSSKTSRCTHVDKMAAAISGRCILSR
jgi:hypothetical protein